MTKEELLKDIATVTPVAQRLPLYKAAMDLGLLTYQEIQQVVKETEPARPVAKKAPAKRATPKNGVSKTIAQ